MQTETTSEITDELKSFIKTLENERVFVQTHNFPDPDAIGAGWGMVGLLKNFGIEATLVFVGQIDRVNTKKMTELCNIKIFADNELPFEMREQDPVICIDSQKNGGNIKDLPGDEVAAIDHHPDRGDDYYRYKDIRRFGSCSTIVAGYFRDMGLVPDERTATALLYGLKMDTMHFTRGVTVEDIRAFEFLFPLASQEILTDLQQNSMEFDDLRAYGAAIENIFVYEKAGFAGIPFACPDAQIATIADFVLSLEEVEVAVLYAKRPDGYKFSVRSETPKIDAGKLIAEALSGIGTGGGHAFMAGGFIPKEKVKELGEYPDDAIRERFYKSMEL